MAKRNMKNLNRKNMRSGREEKNNFQDIAEEREFEKGFKKGKFSAGSCRPATNDPQWYFKSTQILNDVASFSFNKPVGSKLGFQNFHPNGEVTTNGLGTSAIPGLMSIGIGPTAGIAQDAQSPLNLAATNVYSYVRYKNSGASNYDAPDLMMYLVAMDSIYACWNWLKRIYGFASTYSQLNKYEPRAYMIANGVDFDDIMANLADFRGWLNIKSAEISSFCVPATMTYNIRHSWLFSNIYKDSNTAKAQQYMFVPAWFYKYGEVTSTQGTELQVVNVLNNYVPTLSDDDLMTFAQLKLILNSLLEAVNYSEDVGIMSGDILKAYGQGGLFTLSEVSDDYKVEAVYSEEVLTQIENARIITVAADDLPSFSITHDPNTNFLKCEPVLTQEGNITRLGQYVNFHFESPTPQQVVVATRLNAVTQQLDAGGSKLVSCGSEVAVNGYIMTLTQTGPWYTQFDHLKPLIFRAVSVQLPFFDIQTVNNSDFARYLSTMCLLCSFDWAPIQLIGMRAANDAGTMFQSILGTTWDFDNYTLIDDDDLEAMNLMALLTEFNVPN